MQRRLFASIMIASLVAAACATKIQDPAAQRQSLDAQADSALANLNQKVPESKELVAKARGVLVFPSVVTAGLVIGGSWGQGVLRSNGATTGYYQTEGATAGLLAGGGTKAVYVLFMTQEALDKFKNGNGWTVGADAAVTVAHAGAETAVDTETAKRAVIAYVLSDSGLLLDAGLDGAKVRRLDL